MKGQLERVEGGVLIGWIRDETDPERRVRFDLMVDERNVGSFMADRPRDVPEGEIEGAHGFEIELSDEWLRPGRNVLSVWARPEGLLIGKPLVYSIAEAVAPAPPAEEAEPPPAPAGAAEVEVKYLDRPLASGRLGTRTVDAAGLEIVLDTLSAESGDLRSTLERLTDQLFRKRLWAEVSAVCRHFAEQVGQSPRLLAWYGRALLYTREVDASVEALRRLRALAPDHHADVFYLGLALGRQGSWHEALDVFEECISSDKSQPKYHYEAGRALMQLGFGGFGLAGEDPAALESASQRLAGALELERRDWRYYRELSSLLISLGRGDEGFELVKEATERAPAEPRVFTELAKASVRLNRIPEALEAARRAHDLDPRNDTAKFNLRVISRLAETTRAVPEGSLTQLGLEHSASGGELREAIANGTSDWVILNRDAVPEGTDVRSLVARFGFAWAAGIGLTEDGQPIVWRRSYLEGLLRSGVVPATADLDELVREGTRHGQFAVAKPDLARRLRGTGHELPGVLLFSQYGIRRFGGGEHFLQQMAHLYRGLGFEPVVVGTDAERIGEYGEQNRLRYVFIDRSQDEILRLAVSERAALAHVISGLAVEVVMGLRALDVRVIQGVHSWRDMYLPPTPHGGYFPNVDRSSVNSPEFDLVIQDSAAIYANSDYTKAELERAYAVRPPVMYSLPDDVEPSLAARQTEADREYVLLANTRSEKGFDLYLDVAARLAHRTFFAISSQSSRESAEALVHSRGLTNVTILDRVDEMDDLYAKARVVAVPSYRFIETFSRVVIEAQRWGVPVIGSDRGNVPYLLAESGIVLPEDAGAWASEIERLFTDDEEWRARSARALENSERYTFRMQETALSRLVSGVAAPMLVGVGSGLGNIIHATPLLRNLSRRLGRRIDVVVAADHDDLLFLPSNAECVNHTFALTDDVLHRRYDTVYLTNSFGSLVPRFSSSNIVSSRSWDSFHAGHALHEAEFNLAAAEAVLGVAYEPEDISGYFIGDLAYEPPEEVLIGMHGGSKGGVWSSKRWPHYPELARRLQRDGFSVASFGVEEEYIEGTIDMTGGSIEEMSRRLLACTHFVANDSGVMNIANALGIPTVAIFAPTNPETRGPVTATGASVSVQRECAPCEMKSPYREERFRAGKCDCIDAIDIESVHDAVQKMLRQSPVGAAG